MRDSYYGFSGGWDLLQNRTEAWRSAQYILSKQRQVRERGRVLREVRGCVDEQVKLICGVMSHRVTVFSLKWWIPRVIANLDRCVYV